MRSDPVVIRVWKGDERDVFALFPADPADIYGQLCTSYEHVGQHAAADYDLCIRNSRPASEAEAADLTAELRRIGYRPRVLKRASRRHHEKRLAVARGAA